MALGARSTLTVAGTVACRDSGTVDNANRDVTTSTSAIHFQVSGPADSRLAGIGWVVDLLLIPGRVRPWNNEDTNVYLDSREAQ